MAKETTDITPPVKPTVPETVATVDPEELAALKRELGEHRAEITQLRDAGKSIFSVVEQLTKSTPAVKGAAGGFIGNCLKEAETFLFGGGQ